MAVPALRRIREISSEFGLSCSVDGGWYVFEASMGGMGDEKEVERAIDLLFSSNVPGFRLPIITVKRWLSDGKLPVMLSIALGEVNKL